MKKFPGDLITFDYPSGKGDTPFAIALQGVRDRRIRRPPEPPDFARIVPDRGRTSAVVPFLPDED